MTTQPNGVQSTDFSRGLGVTEPRAVATG